MTGPSPPPRQPPTPPMTAHRERHTRSSGLKGLAQLLSAFDDGDLFDLTDPPAAVLVATRQRLAAEFGITPQALGMRISTLASVGVVLQRQPLVFDAAAVESLFVDGRRAGPPQAAAAPPPPCGPVPEMQQIDQLGVTVGSLRANLEVLGLLSDSILGILDANITTSSAEHQMGLSQTLLDPAQTFPPPEQTFPSVPDPPGTPAPDPAYQTRQPPPGQREGVPAAARDFARYPLDLSPHDVARLVTHWGPAVKTNLLHTQLRRWPEIWVRRAVSVIDADITDGAGINRPWAMLYRLAQRGDLDYFPIDAPQRCGWCDIGVLISDDETCCPDCTTAPGEAAAHPGAGPDFEAYLHPTARCTNAHCDRRVRSYGTRDNKRPDPLCFECYYARGPDPGPEPVKTHTVQEVLAENAAAGEPITADEARARIQDLRSRLSTPQRRLT